MEEAQPVPTEYQLPLIQIKETTPRKITLILRAVGVSFVRGNIYFSNDATYAFQEQDHEDQRSCQSLTNFSTSVSFCTPTRPPYLNH